MRKLYVRLRICSAADSKPMRGQWSSHEHSIWNSNKVERTGETMQSFIASDKVSKEAGPLTIFLPYFHQPSSVKASFARCGHWCNLSPCVGKSLVSITPSNIHRGTGICPELSATPQSSHPACSIQQATCPTLPSVLTESIFSSFDTWMFFFIIYAHIISDGK